MRRPAASAAPFLPGFVKGFILQIASLLILIIKLELLWLDANNAWRLCLLAALLWTSAALGLTGTANIAGAEEGDPGFRGIAS